MEFVKTCQVWSQKQCIKNPASTLSAKFFGVGGWFAVQIIFFVNNSLRKHFGRRYLEAKLFSMKFPSKNTTHMLD